MSGAQSQVFPVNVNVGAQAVQDEADPEQAEHGNAHGAQLVPLKNVPVAQMQLVPDNVNVAAHAEQFEDDPEHAVQS